MSTLHLPNHRRLSQGRDQSRQREGKGQDQDTMPGNALPRPWLPVRLPRLPEVIGSQGWGTACMLTLPAGCPRDLPGPLHCEAM